MLGLMRIRRRGRANVAQMRKKGDLSGLLDALRYENAPSGPDGAGWDTSWPLRVEAAESVSDFYGPAVASGLRDALSDPHPTVRLAAVEGLAKLRVPTGVEELLDGIVAWDDPPYGEAAWRALETVAAAPVDLLPEALAACIMEADSVALQERHREALDYLLEFDPRPPDQAAGSVAGHVLSKLDRESDPERRRRDEAVLGWLGPSAADRVIESLGEGRAELAAARAAGDARDARAAEPLIRLLERPSAELREAAATALGEIKDTRAVPSLLAATRDAEASVRDAASGALDAMGVAAVVFGLAALSRAGSEAELAGGDAAGALDGGSGWAERAMGRLLGKGD